MAGVSCGAGLCARTRPDDCPPRAGWRLRRLAMLATLGMFVQEVTGGWKNDYGLFDGSGPWSALVTTPKLGLFQILLVITIIEVTTSKYEGRVPGDIGFDPLGFSDKGIDPNLALAEIKNARLAMIASIAFFVQSAISGEGVLKTTFDGAPRGPPAQSASMLCSPGVTLPARTCHSAVVRRTEHLTLLRRPPMLLVGGGRRFCAHLGPRSSGPLAGFGGVASSGPPFLRDRGVGDMSKSLVGRCLRMLLDHPMVTRPQSLGRVSPAVMIMRSAVAAQVDVLHGPALATRVRSIAPGGLEPEGLLAEDPLKH